MASRYIDTIAKWLYGKVDEKNPIFRFTDKKRVFDQLRWIFLQLKWISQYLHSKWLIFGNKIYFPNIFGRAKSQLHISFNTQKCRDRTSQFYKLQKGTSLNEESKSLNDMKLS